MLKWLPWQFHMAQEHYLHIIFMIKINFLWHLIGMVHTSIKNLRSAVIYVDVVSVLIMMSCSKKQHSFFTCYSEWTNHCSRHLLCWWCSVLSHWCYAWHHNSQVYHCCIVFWYYIYAWNRWLDCLIWCIAARLAELQQCMLGLAMLQHATVMHVAATVAASHLFCSKLLLFDRPAHLFYLVTLSVCECGLFYLACYQFLMS